MHPPKSFFDLETRVLELLKNPFAPNVLPILGYVVSPMSGSDTDQLAEEEGFEPPRPFRV